MSTELSFYFEEEKCMKFILFYSSLVIQFFLQNIRFLRFDQPCIVNIVIFIIFVCNKYETLFPLTRPGRLGESHKQSV